jgi:transcriptional regulator with XRE-family HTH domain
VLKTLREKRGMTQLELATKAGVASPRCGPNVWLTKHNNTG